MWTPETRGRRDRAEDEALSDRSHRRGMRPHWPAAAAAGEARAQARRGVAGGAQCHPPHDPHGRRLAHAAEGLPAVADSLLVVPPLRTVDAFPHHPRRRTLSDMLDCAERAIWLGRLDSNQGSRNQNPLPYHLATPQRRAAAGANISARDERRNRAMPGGAPRERRRRRPREARRSARPGQTNGRPPPSAEIKRAAKCCIGTGLCTFPFGMTWQFN